MLVSTYIEGNITRRLFDQFEDNSSGRHIVMLVQEVEVGYLTISGLRDLRVTANIDVES